MNSWYKTKRIFTQRENAYLDFLSQSFRVQNQYREWIPYNMTDYQKEYHSDSINIKLGESEDILFIKARGISFTWSTLIDLIITGYSFNDAIIPIIAQREATAFEHLETAQKIIKNCLVKELRDDVIFKQHAILFKSTGSKIVPFPSSSAADAIRGVRLITGLIDEFAFQQDDSGIMASFGDAIQGDLGQIKCGSTPCGRNNLFFDLVDRSRKGETTGFKVYELPVFDPNKFNPNILPSKQNIIPLAPWISMKELDKKWNRDRNIFLQENMADFLDDSLSYISYKFVSRCNDPDTLNLKDKVQNEAGFIYETNNPVVVGHDYAETTDLCAISAFEIIPADGERPQHFKQIYLDYFNGLSSPEQQVYAERLIAALPTLQKYRIDMTGPGIGLFQYLKRDNGHIIDGIDFRRTILTSEHKQNHSIRRFMITNFKGLIENQQVTLIDDPKQTLHISSVDYSFKVPKSSKDGHSDILFGNCLACLPLIYKNIRDTSMVTSREFIDKKKEENKELPSTVMIIGEKEIKVRDIPEENMGDKLKRLGRLSGRRL